MRQEKKTGHGTRRAIASSVLAIVLCLVMLVGSTFAWFTDTASTGVNQIVSGTLDVGLAYWNGTAWAEAEDSQELFDQNALWEPGYTQIVYLKVKNDGNLALNYAMQITPVHEQVGVNVDGEEFKLSDYIQFGWAVITAGEDGAFQFADRAAARDAVGESVHLGEALRRQAELPLEAGAEELVALVAWMPEDVGNVANYRDIAPSIELTLKVLATQATVESDSYDNLYDADATEDELKDLPAYDYTYSEQEGIILIPDENGDIVKITVTAETGKIPDGYFKNEKFANLKEVDIQEGVTEIGTGAFASCAALERVTLPDSLEKIGNSAFYGCESLKNLTIPEDTDIGTSAFRRAGLEDVTVNGGAIGEYAFHRTNLKNAVIDCATVGTEAFSGCDFLESVTLTSNVTTLGDAVFYTCDALKSIEIPSSVTSIGEKTFMSCIGLENAVIRGGTVKSGTFYNCSALKTLIISDNGKIDSTFKGMDVKKIETLEVCGGEIGTSAFASCTALTTIKLGEKVTAIGDSAFKSCTALNNAVIKGGTVKNGTFYNCGALKTLIISDNGKMDSTFRGSDTKSLETLEVYSGEIGASAFLGHSALVTVTIGENVTSIGDRAFGSGKKLEEVTIKTEAMNGCMFYNSKALHKVTFGDTVKTIPAKLFNYCDAMQAGGAIYVKPGTWNIGNTSSITVGDDGLIPAETVKTITAANGVVLTYVSNP